MEEKINEFVDQVGTDVSGKWMRTEQVKAGVKAVLQEYHYPKFEDWFDELEKFSFRSERFFETMGMYDNKNTEQIIIWLKAAFECGRMKKGEDEIHPD